MLLTAAAAVTMTIGGIGGHAGAVAANQWNGTNAALTATDGPEVDAIATVGTDLYIAGIFDSAGGVTVANIARYDGQFWWPLGEPNVDGPVDTPVWALIAVGTDLYAGTDGAVWKYDTVTQTWTDLVADTNMGVSVLAWYDDGSNPPYLVAGGFSLSGNACYLDYYDGTDWSSFPAFHMATGTPGNGGWNGCYIESLAVMDHDLYVGGVFDSVGVRSVNSLARFDGVNWSSVGSGGDGVLDDTMFDIDAAPVGDVTTMTVSPDGTELVIGGTFSLVNGVIDATDPSAQTGTGDPARNLAVWDGTTLSAYGGSDDAGVFPAGDDYVTDLKFATDGSLYLAGGTTFPDGGYGLGRLADPTGSDWASVGYGTDDDVLAVAELGDSIWAGGYFTTAYSDDAPTPVDGTDTIARWGIPHTPPQVTVSGITGKPVVGNRLTLSLTVTGSPAPTVTRQWLRCDAPVALRAASRTAQPERLLPDGCTLIDGATGGNYTAQTADVGKYLVVMVMVSNSSGFALDFPVTAVKVAAAAVVPGTTTPTTTPTTTTPQFELPATGGVSAPLAWFALLAVGTGALLLAIRRRTV